MLGDRWGVTDQETTRHYPCDDHVTAPTLQAWRGVHVRAPHTTLWPWVTQIRLAPYSYDWLDNLGRTSPRHLTGLPEPRPGEPFTATGGHPQGRILSVTPGEQFTGTIMGAVLSYVLVPQPDDTTRLLLKVVMRTHPIIALAGSVGDLIMARKQLRTLKHLAEHSS
ncbi:polyketide cyclase [Actinoplanes sp. DH11]|uniref:polyketide cyclase n=1 Tax=Actinoplanes sp. DH11 TaxID=2857011 RepID=UPI001E2D5C35|nr:polyketide cyclase [Actinoplanes sp. DH11]